MKDIIIEPAETMNTDLSLASLSILEIHNILTVP